MTRIIRVCITGLFICLSLNTQARQLGGIYQVPTPEGKKSFETFEVPEYEVKKNKKGHMYLHFELPEDLAGGQELIYKLKKIKTPVASSNFSKWVSSQAEMHCTGQWQNLACVLKFKKLPTERQEHEEFIRSKYSDQPKEEKRLLRVVEAFHHEPIGLVALSELD